MCGWVHWEVWESGERTSLETILFHTLLLYEKSLYTDTLTFEKRRNPPRIGASDHVCVRY